MTQRDTVALAKYVLLTELQELGIYSGTVGAPHVFYKVHVVLTVDPGMAT